MDLEAGESDPGLERRGLPRGLLHPGLLLLSNRLLVVEDRAELDVQNARSTEGMREVGDHDVLYAPHERTTKRVSSTSPSPSHPYHLQPLRS